MEINFTLLITLNAASLLTDPDEVKKKVNNEIAGAICLLGSDLNSQRVLAASNPTISEVL